MLLLNVFCVFHAWGPYRRHIKKNSSSGETARALWIGSRRRSRKEPGKGPRTVSRAEHHAENRTGHRTENRAKNRIKKQIVRRSHQKFTLMKIILCLIWNAKNWDGELPFAGLNLKRNSFRAEEFTGNDWSQIWMMRQTRRTTREVLVFGEKHVLIMQSEGLPSDLPWAAFFRERAEWNFKFS